MTKPRKGALAAPERPRGGGSYIRHPNGGLERTEWTEMPEPYAAPPPAEQVDGNQQQEA